MNRMKMKLQLQPGQRYSAGVCNICADGLRPGTKAHLRRMSCLYNMKEGARTK